MLRLWKGYICLIQASHFLFNVGAAGPIVVFSTLGSANYHYTYNSLLKDIPQEP